MTFRRFGIRSLRSWAIRRVTTQTSDPRIQFPAVSLEDPDETIQGVFVGDHSAMAVGADFRLPRAGRTSAVAPA